MSKNIEIKLKKEKKETSHINETFAFNTNPKTSSI